MARALDRLRVPRAHRHLGATMEWLAEVGAMREVEVDVTDLRKIVAANKAEHREVFLKAQEKYREAVIRVLEERLADARAGKRVRHVIELEAPVDHTKDYERVERMLLMSTKATVTLSSSEFECYVMDRWPWASQFTSNSLSYGVATKFAGELGEDV